jgi:hypothetical protein
MICTTRIGRQAAPLIMRGSCRGSMATMSANLVESIRVDKPFDRNAALREAERRPMAKLLDLPATKGQADLKKFVQFQVGSVFIDNFMDQRLLPFRMRISQRHPTHSLAANFVSWRVRCTVAVERVRRIPSAVGRGESFEMTHRSRLPRASDQSCDGLRAFLASLVPRRIYRVDACPHICPTTFCGM